MPTTAAASPAAFRAELAMQYELRAIIDQLDAGARTAADFADVRALRTAAGELYAETANRYAELPRAGYLRMQRDVAASFGASSRPRTSTANPWRYRASGRSMAVRP